MKQAKIDMLLERLSKVVPSIYLASLESSLPDYGDDCYEALMAGKYKSTLATVLLAVFLGNLGVARFYIGDVVMGAVRLAVSVLAVVSVFINTYVFLFLLAGVYVWNFVDIFMAYVKVKDVNERTVRNYLNTYKQKGEINNERS